MVATIDQAFISQFSDAIHGLVEQKASKARQTVKVDMAKGEKHFFERLGSFTANDLTARLQATNLQDPAHSRRMASVIRREASTYLDDIDKLKMLIDPTNDYTRKLAAAHGRKLDEVIYAAMLGSAASGADGSGTVALPASQEIVHGSAGLTVAKFNEALRILEANEVDIDSVRLYLALGARGVEDLMADSKVVSLDFQDEKALSTGKLPSFRGVNIIRTQRVPDELADTTFQAVLYSEDSVKVAMAQDLVVKVGEDVTKNHVPVISTYMQYGAVRMEEESVVAIQYQ